MRLKVFLESMVLFKEVKNFVMKYGDWCYGD